MFGHKDNTSRHIIQLMSLMVVVTVATSLIIGLMITQSFNKTEVERQHNAQALKASQGVISTIKTLHASLHKTAIQYMQSDNEISAVDMGKNVGELKQLFTNFDHMQSSAVSETGDSLASDTSISTLNQLINQLIHWKKINTPLINDLENDTTLKKVTRLLNQMRLSIDQMNGSLQLKYALKINKFKRLEQSKAGVAALEIIKSRVNQTQSQLMAIKDSLNLLSLYIERVLGIKNIDQIADLRDNQIKPELENFSLLFKSLKNSPIDDAVLQQFLTELLGSGYKIDTDHQTIKIGSNGLFRLKIDYLKSAIKGNEIKASIMQNHEDIARRINGIKARFAENETVLMQQQNQALASTWHNARRIGLIGILIFIAVTLFVFINIRSQIETINLFRKQSEDANKSTQSALIEKEQLNKQIEEHNKNLEHIVNERTQELTETNLKLEHQANHDALIGIPNRAFGLERLKQAIFHAKRKGNLTVLMFIDLDRFKPINDTFGHQAGDEVLIQVAQRLLDVVRKDDTVVRLGGDEFLIILSDVNKIEHIEHIAQDIKSSLQQRFIVNSNELYIGCSIGIAIGPTDSDNAEELLGCADSAMYQAKQQGRNRFNYYTAEMNAASVERMKIESLLHDALDKKEFSLVYQPIVNPQSNVITGAEALLRWNSAELGFIPPDKFIPLLEENGLIVSVGNWVLMQSCHTAAGWNKQQGEQSIAVNISSIQLRSKNFVAQVEVILTETGLLAHCLHLELTERILVEDSEYVNENIKQIQNLGVHFSIDDFGTGYSSLSYLKRFPAQFIKIDKSFTQDIDNDQEGKALVDAIIHMGHSLSRQIIAEGVETEEQLSYLKEKNCDFIQGYLFSKPINAEEYSKLLTKSFSLAEVVAFDINKKREV